MPTDYHLVQTLVLKCFKGDHKVIESGVRIRSKWFLKVFSIPSALINELEVSNKGIQIKIRYFEKKKNNCFGDTPSFSLLILIILFLIHEVSFIEE